MNRFYIGFLTLSFSGTIYYIYQKYYSEEAKNKKIFINKNELTEKMLNEVNNDLDEIIKENNCLENCDTSTCENSDNNYNFSRTSTDELYKN